MPVQKTGRLTPVTATAMLSLSSQEYCRVAETMPAARPERHRDGERARGQDHGGLEAQQHLGQHLAAERDGAAEIALDHAAHPLEVLQRHRPVQPQVAAQALHVFLRGLRAQHDGGRIARGQAHHPEDEQRDPDQDGQRQQDAADDVALEARPSYCSHTCVSTRSKFGWSLNPCTRLR